MPIIELHQIYTAILGYLLGSVSFGLLFTRMAGKGDIRHTGSGNIGATNVLRSGHKVLALMTLIGDSGKGALAAFTANFLWGMEAGLIAGLTVVLGHNFSIWLKFKGGKGVATSLGVLLFIAWPVGFSACATWLLVAGILRYSSLAALAALCSAPAYAYWMDMHSVAWMAGGLGALAIVRHKQNITRLIKGTESKIGSNK